METESFLADTRLRKVNISRNCPFQLVGLALGQGASALEVLVVTYNSEPPTSALHSLWSARHGNRAAPLLLVVLYGDKATVQGPTSDNPAISNLDRGQVERICREALDQPDRHAALRALRDSLEATQSELTGIRNKGFLATHELNTGVRRRPDWTQAGEKARHVLGKRGEDLFRGLGFSIKRNDQVTSILQAGDHHASVALLLKQRESPELQETRFADSSPIFYALTVADRKDIPYVLLQHGAKLRLYPVRPDIAIGRGGRTETFIECHTDLLSDSDAALFWLLFSADALKPDGSLKEILGASKRFTGDVANKLRERIYGNVIPKLAEGIIRAQRLRKPKPQSLAQTYEMTMVLLFRLLFIAYAEDTDLLPYQWNKLYQRHSLKTKAQKLLEHLHQESKFTNEPTLWNEISRLFKAINDGKHAWGVPAYNGGLFAYDKHAQTANKHLDSLSLPDTIIGPALIHLLLVETEEGLGKVDFRGLGTWEFGTIYQGCLESELSIAEADLLADKKGIYRPCHKREIPTVMQGEVYLHNASGARKASGSYFTKPFAVKHLLDQALEPALIDHLARLDDLDEVDAGDHFFDFRVADIAMGSGHFLVAALDRIEHAFVRYLAKRPLPRVAEELTALKNETQKRLRNVGDPSVIEVTQLLRRLIVRRCIYGVDINQTAVQLTKLALWIDTFVPGLALPYLDHHLVCSNSLVGIGQLSEIEEEFKRQSLPLFPIDAQKLLGKAAKPLQRLAMINDITISEINRAREAHEDARKAVAPVKALCDIITAFRIEKKPLPLDITEWTPVNTKLLEYKEYRQAQKIIESLKPLHFPVAFPEVFLRERPGFDVIVGNPPWEKVRIEEHEFWCRYTPGLRGLIQREKETQYRRLRRERNDLCELLKKEQETSHTYRKALTCGVYQGMGTGDPDLYKAFCWRFWYLVSPRGGHIGVVLPRSVLVAKGSFEFRQIIFTQSSTVSITTLLNNQKWFFEDVHPQYTIGLVALERNNAKHATIALKGPYSSFKHYTGAKKYQPAVFQGKEILQWNDTASLPLLPTKESAAIFSQLRKAPRFDLDDGKSWRVRPYRELDATNDKKYMDLKSEKCPPGFWPVYKGGSFDLWQPDTGTYYAWADPKTVLPMLGKQRLRAIQNHKSVFSEFAPEWLHDEKTMPCNYPRIAFRDVTRATDSRTVRVALIPPNVFVNHKAPYLIFPRGEIKEIIYLLGVMSSIPFDWYARRLVETSLTYFVLNPFPVPRTDDSHSLYGRSIALSGRLASPDKRFAGWAKEVGVEYGPLSLDQKNDMIHELDAVVAHLYGLKEKQLVHIFKTFHAGWDYQDRLDATLKYFYKWKQRL